MQGERMLFLLRAYASEKIAKVLKDIVKITNKRISPEALPIILFLMHNVSEKEWGKILEVLRDSYKEANTITYNIINDVIRKHLYKSTQAKEEKFGGRDGKLKESKTRSIPAISKLTGKNRISELRSAKIEDYILSQKISNEREILPPSGKLEKTNIKDSERDLSKSISSVMDSMTNKALTEKSTVLSEFSEEKVVKEIPLISQEKIMPSLKFEPIKVPQRVVIEDSTELFRQYFVNRYMRIREILLKRISRGVNGQGSSEDYLIVMVREKRTERKKKIGILIGDTLEREIRIIVPLEGDLAAKFKHILLDSVIAVEVKPRKDKGYYLATDIIFPETPVLRERNRTPFSVKIAFISDIHVGSSKFLRESFYNFINFINCQVDDEELRKLAKEIRYIFIIGDLVDGIGVYPEQKSELEIVDIYRQYEELADLLEKIPREKTIIAIPGNHDAAGKFVPQPPIPEKIAQPLYSIPNIKILGNPAWIRIGGVKILLYHGYGIEHMAADLELPIQEPSRILVEMLRNRHLMPTWGKIPVAPTKEDYLVIDEVPDILAVGHIHIADIRISKGGVVLLSTGSFQDLTIWQRQLGIKPTPGIVPIIDLNTYDINVIKCDRKGCWLIQ